MPRASTTTSLFAPDVAETIDFYTDVLGFEVTGRWDEDGRPLWAELARPSPNGLVRLWFFAGALPGKPVPVLTGLIYIFVDDVDAEAAKIAPHVKALWGPEDQEYGLREFGFEDLNGYMLVYAKDTEPV